MRTAGVVPPPEVVETTLDDIYCPHCDRSRSQSVRERSRAVEDEYGTSVVEYYYVFVCEYCGYEFSIPDGFDFDVTFTLTSRGLRFGQVAKFMNIARELGAEPEAGILYRGDQNQLTIQISSGRVLQALDLKSQVKELQTIATGVTVDA
jgi:hypothetical protein